MNFQSMMKKYGNQQVDNSEAALADKVKLRELVLDAVPGRVFDAFAGEGVMYKAVWNRAAGYEGCDERYLPDERVCFVADCRRVMRNIDLQPFSIFDFDCYGSPWEACVILAARRAVAPGERVGLVLTEGSGISMTMGGISASQAELAGLRPRPAGRRTKADGLPGLRRAGGHEEMTMRALRALAVRMKCKIESVWKAERKARASMLYLSTVMVGE